MLGHSTSNSISNSKANSNILIKKGNAILEATNSIVITSNNLE